MDMPNIYLKNGRFQTDENNQLLSLILEAISSWKSLDQLVTFALRKTGYGGDWFGIEYPEDLDEYDKEVLGLFIPEGFVHITVDPETHVIREEELATEKFYLSALVRCLLLKSMDERALIVKRLIDGDLSVFKFVEANPKQCVIRWSKFRPYLEQSGWVKCKRP